MQPDQPARSMKPKTRMFIAGWIIAAIWLLLDQGSKWWILEHVMAPPRIIPVTGYFNLVLGWNQGVSFGLLSDFALPPWTLALFALLVSGVLLVSLLWIQNWLVAIGLGMLAGGAASNALDRLRHGAVTDFIDFHLAGWHWPAFNLADVGIVVGVILLAWDSVVVASRPASDAR